MKVSKLYKKTSKYIKIIIPSSDQIKSLAFGEVKKPETLNYRNLTPSKGGLFCDKIFGSINKYTCSCGNVSVLNESSLICTLCKSEISQDRLRRMKTGYINFSDRFFNSLFFKSKSPYISLIINISLFNINNILYNNYYIVISNGVTKLRFKQILTFDEYLFYYKKYSDKFYAETGFLAIKLVLDFFNLNKEIKLLKIYFKNNHDLKKPFYKKQIKRYRLFLYLKKNNVNFRNLNIKTLMVLPCDLRPIVKLSDDTVASSDLNELYKRIIIRNNRLKMIKRFNISDIIENHEKKLIQEGVDNLFDNDVSSVNVYKGFNNQPLKSITSNIKGKLGLFRHNLLGKRVDFSGRSVIVSGPFLNIDECSLPKDIALELFRPFIYSKLLKLGDKFNIRNVKIEVDRKTDLVFDILNDLLKDRFVLLNRAPTLHRLGMQSFKALLTNDKAIKLHPLVCSAFNADFDGDQMAVHIPLSIKSKNEFKTLLLSSNNVLHPANGDFTIAPTQDIILGIYYATKIVLNFNKFMYFNSLNDVKLAYNFNLIKLNTKIFFRIKDNDIYNNNKSNSFYKFYETTMGRCLIYNILPYGYSFSIVNKNFRKNDIIDLLNLVHNDLGVKVSIKLSNDLMRLGFNFVTQSGISISIDDMLTLDFKKELIFKSKKLVTLYNLDYLNGLLSDISRKKKILDIWQLTIETLSNLTMENLYYKFGNKFFNNYDLSDSLYMMIDSGARGSDIQMRQICSMRGLVVYKNYGFMEVPVINNLKEGLGVLEYFYFSHSSRKSLADTALKTSSAGYLTRRLVEVVKNIFISKFDCKTKNGILFKNLVNNGNVIESVLDRIIGRVSCDNIYGLDGKIFKKKNTIIFKDDIDYIKNFNIDLIKIRSPLTCSAKKGICSLCYGIDLSKGFVVSIGEMVGVIAAQAIGEPGTQLTMRTFHTGGAFSANILSSSISSNTSGVLEYSTSLKYVLNRNNNKVVISKIGKIKIKNFLKQELESFNIPYSSVLFFDNNSLINIGDIICKWDSDNRFILSDFNGYIIFMNFNSDNFIKRLDFYTNKYNYEIINSFKFNKSFPYLKLCKNLNNFEKDFIKYKLIPGDFILVNDKELVFAGDIIVRNSINIESSLDITGGLPKIIDLFEARVPKISAILAPFDGKVVFNKSRKNKICLSVISKIDNYEFCFSSDRDILIYDGQIVNKGDILVNGTLNPHDILNIYGINDLVFFFLNEIKSIYFSQSVKISDKHIEIIIRQMLSNVMVINPGDSNYVVGEIISKEKANRINKKLLKKKKNKIIYNVILTGITKTSLMNKSFLSSASFQQTTAVLTHAAMISRVDNLKNFKSDIMLGKIMPVGTGYYNKVFKKK